MSYLPIESVYTERERESILTCNNNQSGPIHCHPNTQQLPKETKKYERSLVSVVLFT